MLIANSDIVSPNLAPAVAGSLVFALVGIVILFLILLVGWKVIDRLTPGVLSDQLAPAGLPLTPNVALAIVVGCMFLGVTLGAAVIIAAAIH